MKGFIAVILLVAAVVAENQCPPDQGEEDVLLLHADCDKFYKCTFGEPVEQLCYPGLFFNEHISECDWQHNVECGDRNIPNGNPEESEEAVPAQPEETPEVVPEAPVSESEEAVDNETEESPIVVPEAPVSESEEAVDNEPEESPIVVPEAPVSESEEAVDNEPEESPIVVPEAPVSESEEENKTEAPESEEAVQSEEEKPVEPEQPEGSAEQPEIEFLENGCPVDPHVHWLLPNEENCNEFYYCVRGEKELRKCDPTMHFNRELQVCDWPWAAGCATSFNKHMRALFHRLSSNRT